MTFFRKLLRVFLGGDAPKQSTYTAPVVQSTGKPCVKNCGNITSYIGHELCRPCWKASNPETKLSFSRQEGYNRIIELVGTSNLSEMEFKNILVNQHRFLPEDVNSIASSSTIRKIMGW